MEVINTCEEANMIDCKVQPEPIGEGWPLGEICQVGTNAAQELPKERLASQDWDWNIGWYRPTVYNPEFSIGIESSLA